jgi:hypothetical protein
MGEFDLGGWRAVLLHVVVPDELDVNVSKLRICRGAAVIITTVVLFATCAGASVRATKPPLASAPPCTASLLVVASVRPLGISLDDGVGVALRNTGRTACLLRGRPHAVASESGAPTVTARPEGMPPDSSQVEIAKTVDPGRLVYVWIDVPVYCAADPGGGSQGLPVYKRLLISFPGGGSSLIAVHFVTVACGIRVTPFFTWKS